MSAEVNQPRRGDLAMDADTAWRVLEGGHTGRLGTVGADGAPYVVPMLYVCRDQRVYLHTARAPGRMQANLAFEARVCFVVDEPGEFYRYGRFQCDSSLSYRSVMVFGRATRVDDEAASVAFFDALMAKYAPVDPGRPAGFYPRIKQIAVYAIEVDQIVGKQIRLPMATQRWPAIDRSKTPDAVAPPASEAPPPLAAHLTGGCLCGQVRYAIAREPVAMYHCHCGDCRKASGASFATNIMVRAADLAITAGAERLARFESSPAKYRHFCGHCGSPIFSQAAATQQFVSVRCGTLDGDPGLRPAAHAFVDSKAAWTDVLDGLPRFAGAIR